MGEQIAMGTGEMVRKVLQRGRKIKRLKSRLGGKGNKKEAKKAVCFCKDIRKILPTIDKCRK